MPKTKISSETSVASSKLLSPREIERGIEKLNGRITDLSTFDLRTVAAPKNPPELIALETSIERTLGRIFGEDTVEYNRYIRSSNIQASFAAWSDNFPAASDYRERISSNIQRSIHLLKDAVQFLREEIEELAGTEVAPGASAVENVHYDRIFIVHGHNNEKKETVARFVERIGFNAVILHEQANKGRTIISKFREEAADVGFAIVLMTPDDIGGNSKDNLNQRARQNVVFELGFFIGSLGPDRVAALVSESVERPSDLDGVIYISLDSSDWKQKLAQELKAAGFHIDWNKVMC